MLRRYNKDFLCNTCFPAQQKYRDPCTYCHILSCAVASLKRCYKVQGTDSKPLPPCLKKTLKQNTS